MVYKDLITLKEFILLTGESQYLVHSLITTGIIPSYRSIRDTKRCADLRGGIVYCNPSPKISDRLYKKEDSTLVTKYINDTRKSKIDGDKNALNNRLIALEATVFQLANIIHRFVDKVDDLQFYYDRTKLTLDTMPEYLEAYLACEFPEPDTDLYKIWGETDKLVDHLGGDDYYE